MSHVCLSASSSPTGLSFRSKSLDFELPVHVVALHIFAANSLMCVRVFVFVCAFMCVMCVCVFFMCVCLFVCVRTRVYLRVLCVCVSACWCVCRCNRITKEYESISPFHVETGVCTCMRANMFDCLYICVYVCRSVCLYVCTNVCV